MSSKSLTRILAAGISCLILIQSVLAYSTSTNIEQCRQKKSEFSRSFCFMEIATAQKDVAICNNIAENEDKYLCYAQVAKAAQDPKICHQIPPSFAVDNQGNDILKNCYKGIDQLNPRKNKELRSIVPYFSVEKDASLIKRICSGPTRDEAFFQGELRECGSFYMITYDRSILADAPDLIIDRNEKVIASCGGMPPAGAKRNRSKECDIRAKCDKKDLCHGHPIDCNAFKIAEVPPSDYTAQVNHYKQVLTYDYLGATESSLLRRCKMINARR